MEFEECIGKHVVISRSYCRSTLLEVVILQVKDNFVKYQTCSSDKVSFTWERKNDIRIELVLDQHGRRTYLCVNSIIFNCYCCPLYCILQR